MAERGDGALGFDVIVCGSLHLDIVVKAPALPRIDETAVGSAWSQVCGGKGGNQAVQAAKAGARTAMIGRIGNDDFGLTLKGNLQASGVDVSCLSTDETKGYNNRAALKISNTERTENVTKVVEGKRLTYRGTNNAACA